MGAFFLYKYQQSPSLSTHSRNFPEKIKKYKYFYGSTFIRKAQLIFWRSPGEDFNNVLTEMVNNWIFQNYNFINNVP